MRRGRLAIAGVVLAALIGGTTGSADAKPAPLHSRDASSFQKFDVSKVRPGYRPQFLSPAATVTAIVELKGDTLSDLKAAAQARGQKFDEAAAIKSLKARQDAVGRSFASAKATITGRYMRVLNALRVTVSSNNVAALGKLPGVNAVHVSRKIARPQNANSAAYTGVPSAWESVGGLTGSGVKVGIIDTGIDYYHADFNGLGAAAYAADDGTVAYPNFPTGKVVGGYDFVGDDYDADSYPFPSPDDDPLDCEGHGTHVAGTAAGMGVLTDGSTYTGPYDTSLNPGDFTVFPGAAPEAQLYAYRVFGCDGSVDDWIIVDAIEMAVADGVDVVNMSLGAAFGTGGGLDEKAVNAASKAGTLVVMSAGNEGSGAYITGGPGAADRGISIAAVDGGFESYFGATLDSIDYANPDVPLVTTNDVPVGAPIAGYVLRLGLGCDSSDYGDGDGDWADGDPATGKIVVATRGTCDRVFRAIEGAKNGALAVILVNNNIGFPPFEGPIPGVGIPFLGADGSALIEDGDWVSIDPAGPVANPGFGNTATFSSNGPRNGDSSQKPDMSAPGVSVFSAAVGTGDQGFFLSGTSMASPHAAGIAALVTEAHPTWTPAQIKSALMSTADNGLIGDFDSRRNGTGMVRAEDAVTTKAYISTSDYKNSLNFGFVPITNAYNEMRQFTITNTGASDITYDLVVDPSSPMYGSVKILGPNPLKVKAGTTATVRVSLQLTQAQAAALPNMTPDYWNQFSDGSDFGSLISFNGLVHAIPQVPGPGVGTLSVAYMMVPKHLSDVDPKATTVKVTGGGTTLSLMNKGKHAGLVDIYAAAQTDATNEFAPGSTVANLANVGVQTVDYGFDNVLFFAVNLANHSSTQSIHEVAIWVDTNGDEDPDYLIDVADFGLITTGSPNGSMGAVVFSLPFFDVVGLYSVSAPANGSAMSIPVVAGDLGLSPGSGWFQFTTEGYSVVETGVGGDWIPGWASFDAYDPVLETGQVFEYQPAATTWNIPAGVDVSELGNQSPRGWLILSMDDLHGGKSAQVIKIVGPIS